MIFPVRQIQGKSLEQSQDLYITFIDLTNAFDTVKSSLSLLSPLSLSLSLTLTLSLSLSPPLPLSPSLSLSLSLS